MKKLACIALVLFSFYFVSAQEPLPETVAPYLRFPTTPPFKLLKVDSATYVTKENIRKNHRTIIMVFSPECDHCKHQTEEILKEAAKFKDVEIVMATFQPFAEMKEFYSFYRIADHPNIKLGRDEKFVLPPFFRIRSLPFLALYDKKGALVTTFEGNQTAEKLLNAFNKK